MKNYLSVFSLSLCFDFLRTRTQHTPQSNPAVPRDQNLKSKIACLSLSLSLVLVPLNDRLNAQSVAINTNGDAAHPSAILDVSSTHKGILLPRLTSFEKSLIQDPAPGLMVYDITTSSYWYYSNGWQEMSGGSFTLPYTATASDPQHLLSITNTFNDFVSNASIIGRRFSGSNFPLAFSTAIWGDATIGTGVLGTSNTHPGVYGKSQQEHGVYGLSEGGNGFAGVYGRQGTTGLIPAIGMGVWGDNDTGIGVVGTSNTGVGTYGLSNGNHGVYGYSTMANFAGVYGSSSVSNGIGVRGEISGSGAGVEGRVQTPLAVGVRGISTATENGIGIRGEAAIPDTEGTGVYGTSYASSLAKGGVVGFNGKLGGIGVNGRAPFGIGVNGFSQEPGGIGVRGRNENGGIGIYGTSLDASFNGPYENPLIGVKGTVFISPWSDNTGYGVLGSNTGDGDGVRGYAGWNGSGISGFDKEDGGGRAGFFKIAHPANLSEAVKLENEGKGISLYVEAHNPDNSAVTALFSNHGTGDFAVFKDGNGTNKIRFDNAGKGFFSGGTQTGGADIAEAFDTEDDISAYEPGDVLVISMSHDRTVAKSAEPYSDLVAGVYATKPGVLMTEENIDTDLSDQVPMGVIGVIPTKVCLEGGEIHRGDLLVTSSTPGVAMKGDRSKIRAGQVLGKALENHAADGIRLIRVLVNVQ